VLWLMFEVEGICDALHSRQCHSNKHADHRFENNV
jgi:hypothetical protein